MYWIPMTYNIVFSNFCKQNNYSLALPVSDLLLK